MPASQDSEHRDHLLVPKALQADAVRAVTSRAVTGCTLLSAHWSKRGAYMTRVAGVGHRHTQGILLGPKRVTLPNTIKIKLYISLTVSRSTAPSLQWSHVVISPALAQKGNGVTNKTDAWRI